VRRTAERIGTRALVVRRVPVGEADLMVTFVTRERGTIAASAGSARRSSSKLGALEPMHTLRVEIDLVAGRDVGRLREARIETPRLELCASEERLHAASELLRAARTVIPALSPEPNAFDAIERGLDELARATSVGVSLARALANVLEALGVGITLDGCVSCGTPCPPESAAFVDPARGGLVCQSCGGGPLLLKGGVRQRLAAALRGELDALATDDEITLLRIVRRAAEEHGIAPKRSLS
jgi:DNA repair protein RecO (recombination protein O)